MNRRWFLAFAVCLAWSWTPCGAQTPSDPNPHAVGLAFDSTACKEYTTKRTLVNYVQSEE
jgi:hypothetical protein